MMRGNHRVLFLLWHYIWMICDALAAATSFAPERFAFAGLRNPSASVGRRPKITPGSYQRQRQRRTNSQTCYGWLENFFEPDKSSSSGSRKLKYPEQYPATYETNEEDLPEDAASPEARLVRPLLKNTQLQSRPLKMVYDANKDGWNPVSFHEAVDGMGASVVLATDQDGKLYGGYNPKGYASLGGARPSVAAFLFYQRSRDESNIDSNGDDTATTVGFQKLRKVGGGGLACAKDDPNFGISFGPDALVIGLQGNRERRAASKLGPYFEKGPEDLLSLFSSGSIELSELKVLVGCYDETEDIPYSGGVLDMTSG